MTETISIVVALFAVIGAVVGLYGRFSYALKTLNDETDSKRSRVYQRIDEEKKKAMKNTHQKKFASLGMNKLKRL